MACSEITEAIKWAATAPAGKSHPVKAYFTLHLGHGGEPVAHKDAVHYAVGTVSLFNQPKPHLAGSLSGYQNGGGGEGMVANSALSYSVEIFDDGTLSYQMKLNGKPVGGMPPTKVAATCVKNGLLTAIVGGQVVAVGVARKPVETIPPK